jgi:hypothetical protein
VALAFSSFQKRQITFEIRYDDAYALWDVAGELRSALRSKFIRIHNGQTQPDGQTFHADGRFTILTALQRSGVTDFQPGASWEKSFEIIRAAHRLVAQMLELTVLTRIGTRFQYAAPAKSLADARKRVAQHSWASAPDKLFQIEPTSIAPALKIEADDGELGYVAQLYAQERQVTLDASPDMIAAGIEAVDKKVPEVMLDFDFMTKQPMPIEAFNVDQWLDGWQRAINRDAEAFLNMRVKA